MYRFTRSMVRLMLISVSVAAIACATVIVAGGAPKPRLVATSLLGQNEWQAGETAWVRVSTTDIVKRIEETLEAILQMALEVINAHANRVARYVCSQHGATPAATIRSVMASATLTIAWQRFDAQRSQA